VSSFLFVTFLSFEKSKSPDGVPDRGRWFLVIRADAGGLLKKGKRGRAVRPSGPGARRNGRLAAFSQHLLLRGQSTITVPTNFVCSTVNATPVSWSTAAQLWWCTAQCDEAVEPTAPCSSGQLLAHREGRPGRDSLVKQALFLSLPSNSSPAPCYSPETVSHLLSDSALHFSSSPSAPHPVPLFPR
jgi:hypothetical protein